MNKVNHIQNSHRPRATIPRDNNEMIEGEMDGKYRSVVKALLWTLVGLVMMALVGIVFTGSLATGGIMALVNAALGFVSYLAYERIWAKISWGRG